MELKNEIVFIPAIPDIIQQTSNSFFTCLTGSNNTGKSLVLKWLKLSLSKEAYLIGTNRFYHVHLFSSGIRDEREIDQFEQQFESQFYNEEYNHEQNFLDLNRVIINLSDERRKILFELCGKLIGAKFQLKKIDENNEMSPRYIDMDGQSLSVSSTGTRLLMTILGICMDDRFGIILIDEPELGLSPRVQRELANFFTNKKEREQIFPHLKQVIVATHSQHFLNGGEMSANYVVSKKENTISIDQIKNLSHFHRVQFNLLGNSLEALSFPSAILIVEGKTDLLYIQRLIQLKFPNHRITIVSDSDVKRKVNDLKTTLGGDLAKSPYHDRLFVVVDSVHQVGLDNQSLIKLGMNPSNLIVWNKNGIEYLYPPSILAAIFSCSPQELEKINVADDRITLNEITKTKNELALEVVGRMQHDTPLPAEITDKLLQRVAKAII